MEFLQTKRVIYEINPLEEVKSQIRFPPILAIDATVPTHFQEIVRARFPFFEVKKQIQLPQGIPKGIAQMIEGDVAGLGNKSYLFSSSDRLLSVNLSKESIVLTCRNYEKWEIFQKDVRWVIEAFNNVYRPSFFTHTCIRYKNSIRREPLNLDSRNWSDLLQPWISGVFHDKDFMSGVEMFQNRCVIQIPQTDDKIEANFALGVHHPTNKPAFIIEAHVFNDSQKDLENVHRKLDSLHAYSGAFFRKCITDELHRAMRPSEI